MFSDEPTGYRILTSTDIQDGMVDWYQLQSIDYKDTKFDKYAVHLISISEAEEKKTLL